jgi:hypothetical protein
LTGTFRGQAGVVGHEWARRMGDANTTGQCGKNQK